MCKTLMKLMNEYEILANFYLQCVDDMSDKDIPNDLERVPTIILCNYNKPLVAKEAMKWFDENRAFFLQLNNEREKKRILYNIYKNMGQFNTDGCNGYSNTEYEGLSDIFAYTDLDYAQPKIYCGFGKDNNIIFTPPKEKRKLTAQEQDRLITERETERSKQESQIAVNMNMERLNAVIKKEHKELINEQLGLND